MLANKDAIQIVPASTSCSAPLMVACNKIRFSRYKAQFYYYIYTYLSICLFLFLSLVSTLSLLCPEYLHCLSFSLYVCLSFSLCVICLAVQRSSSLVYPFTMLY